MDHGQYEHTVSQGPYIADQYSLVCPWPSYKSLDFNQSGQLKAREAGGTVSLNGQYVELGKVARLRPRSGPEG